MARQVTSERIRASRSTYFLLFASGISGFFRSPTLFASAMLVNDRDLPEKYRDSPALLPEAREKTAQSGPAPSREVPPPPPGGAEEEGGRERPYLRGRCAPRESMSKTSRFSSPADSGACAAIAEGPKSELPTTGGGG